MADVPSPPNRQSDEPSLAVILGDGIRTLQELAERIGFSVAQLQSDFETKIKYDQSKDQTIDALHQELEAYRQDFVLRIMQPLVHDLLMLHDDIGQIVNGYSSEQPAAIAEVLAHLEDVQNDLLAILERYGFEAFHTTEPHHDRQQQRVQRVIPTDDPALDYQVAKRLRKGLRYGEKIIRPEIVEIYRYKSAIGKTVSSSTQKDAPKES